MKKVRRFSKKCGKRWLEHVGTDDLCAQLFADLNVSQAKTFFAYSKLPLVDWFRALWEWASNDGKVTAVELSERCGVEIKAAQRMRRKLRAMYCGRIRFTRYDDRSRHYRQSEGFDFRLSPDILISWRKSDM